MLQQFNNPANQCIYFRTAGPATFNDNGTRIDYFVAGAGNGGKFTGVSRFLKKEKRLKICSIAVEPATSAELSGSSRGRHRIQGIGAGFIPGILDRSMVDEVTQVLDDQAGCSPALTPGRNCLRSGDASGIASRSLRGSG